MSLVYGDNINLYVKLLEADAFEVILCNKSCTLNISTEVAERTTVESGIYKQFKPMAISGSLQSDGDIDYSTDTGVNNLIDWQLALETIFWQMETISEDATQVTYSGRAVIETANITGAVNAPGSYSLNLIIDGEITKT
jgi:hypothetical protein